MATSLTSITNLSLKSLLLLRIALDDNKDNTDIRQDIHDLYLFPERLTDSYPDEWRAYIRRRLVELKLSLNDTELTQCIANSKAKYKSLLCILEQAEITSHTNNIQALKTPLHKWLEWAVS